MIDFVHSWQETNDDRRLVYEKRKEGALWFPRKYFVDTYRVPLWRRILHRMGVR